MNDTEHTKVGVAAIIRSGASVLLGLKGRAFSPEFTNKWVTPGGRVKFKEPLTDAIKREVLEETGLIVEVVKTLPSQELIHDKGHYVFFCFEVYPVGGELKAGDDLSDVKWFRDAEIHQMHDRLTPLTATMLNEKAEP